MGIRKKHVNEFPTPYTCTAAIREGGMETKLSMVLMGFGNIMHKQKIKGLIYLAVEVAYVVFMVLNGIRFLSMLGTLGTVEQKEVWDEVNQIYTYTKGDQSVLIFRYDPFHRYQPERDKSKRILEILLRSLLCRSDVCLPFDYENDASAGGSGQRVASESGTDCTGRQPSVFHGSDVGEGDCHCHQYLGWCTVYATSAYRSSSEYSGRTL